MQRTLSCAVCHCHLSEPYIRCDQCPQVHICLHCFTRGSEFGQHQSDHSYEVIKNDFSLLDENWTAGENVALLDAVKECGLGNWADISKKLRTKSATQCESHYRNCFVENPNFYTPDLLEPPTYHHPPPIPMRFCENPPRPSDGSTLQQDLSGYMAARGDFIVEHSNYAEMELRDIQFPATDTDFDRQLKFAVVDVYCNVVRERQRRKRIIRDHGLISAKNHLGCRVLSERCQGSSSHPLMVFVQLVAPDEWDFYITALNYEVKLKQKISQLQYHRSMGVKRLHSARVHSRLNARRQENKKQRLALSASLTSLQSDQACEEWIQKQGVADKISRGLPVHIPNPARRAAPPLHIVGLPGYEKLSEAERKLCSTVRFVPESFLEFKKILIAENKKLGYVRLAQARTLIKIDVNKTRKLYDFLVKADIIRKEPTTCR